MSMSMSMSMSTPFNAKVYVSSQLNNQLLNTAQTVAIRCVEELSKKYDFDAEEEIRLLGLDTIKLERKGEAKSKAVKAAKESVPKPSFPLPYNGEYSENMCNALRQNSGLYTQCTGERNGESAFCKGCLNRMQKLGSETPEYGTIQQRQEVDILAYVDPQGRKPIAYTKIMNKYKKSKDDVLEEATKFGITIDERHFIAPEQPKRGRPSTKTSETVAKKTGVKGRPKKSKKVITIQGDDEDLFAALVAEANEADSQDKAEKEAEKEAKKTEKEAEKAEKEAKRLAEKAEKEAEKEAKKTEKEAEKAEKEAKRLAEKAEKEAEKAEKEAKRLAEKAEKEAKRLAEKAEKEAEKAEKEAKRLAEKEAKKAEKEAKKAEKEAKKAEKEAKKAAVEEEEEEPDIVKKIDFEGKKYLKSKKTGIVYDYEKYVNESEQLVVGKWSEEEKKIIFNHDNIVGGDLFSDEEEVEEEYDA